MSANNRLSKVEINEFQGNVTKKIIDLVGIPLLTQANQLARALYDQFGFEAEIRRSKLPDYYFQRSPTLPLVLSQRKKAPIRLVLPFGGSHIGAFAICDRKPAVDCGGVTTYEIVPRFEESERFVPRALDMKVYNFWGHLEKELPELMERITLSSGSESFDAVRAHMLNVENFNKQIGQTSHDMSNLAYMCKTSAKLEVALRENGCEDYVSCIPARSATGTAMVLRADVLTAGLRKLAKAA